MELSGQKGTPLLALVIALLVGYIGYTGAVIDMVGFKGLAGTKERILHFGGQLAQPAQAVEQALERIAAALPFLAGP